MRSLAPRSSHSKGATMTRLRAERHRYQAQFCQSRLYRDRPQRCRRRHTLAERAVEIVRLRLLPDDGPTGGFSTKRARYLGESTREPLDSRNTWPPFEYFDPPFRRNDDCSVRPSLPLLPGASKSSLVGQPLIGARGRRQPPAHRPSAAPSKACKPLQK